jgi:hypothetical protein
LNKAKEDRLKKLEDQLEKKAKGTACGKLKENNSGYFLIFFFIIVLLFCQGEIGN